MPAHDTVWTAEMVRALPDDGNRYEVLDGELLVTPAPSRRHQAVLANLFRWLDPYVRKFGLGRVYWSPADIRLSPKDVIQPDLFVVPDTETGQPNEWDEVQELRLVVEGLSPSTARSDRMKKRPAYQKHRIPEYWILDIDARIVERWCPDDERPEVVVEVLTWQPNENVEPLAIPLREVFET